MIFAALLLLLLFIDWCVAANLCDTNGCVCSPTECMNSVSCVYTPQFAAASCDMFPGCCDPISMLNLGGVLLSQPQFSNRLLVFELNGQYFTEQFGGRAVRFFLSYYFF